MRLAKRWYTAAPIVIVTTFLLLAGLANAVAKLGGEVRPL
jgi:hypothetical protein